MKNKSSVKRFVTSQWRYHKELFRCSTQGQAPGLTHKHLTGLEKLARDKHSGLLRKFVNYQQKKFHNIKLFESKKRSFSFFYYFPLHLLSFFQFSQFANLVFDPNISILKQCVTNDSASATTFSRKTLGRTVMDL